MPTCIGLTGRRLWERIEEIDFQLRHADAVRLFLDFDGTLSPIVDRPSRAELPVDTRRTLEALALDARVSIAIVSGRALNDVWTRVGLPGLIYAGNHGLEIIGPGFTFIEPTAAICKETLHELARSITARLEDVPGIEVEDKGLTASIHFRRCARIDLDRIRTTAESAVATYEGIFRLTENNEVLEVRPSIAWDKGLASLWIMERMPSARNPVAIYIGDDRTDEDAFRELVDGVTIRVGPSATSRARYYLGAQHEVVSFLAWLGQTILVDRQA
jgi:trehalose-phosphatase